MRADRLLTLLLLLQNRGRMTAAELATELDVSPRTVYRDVEALSASGVPVYADRGPAGGYRLAQGYRTRLTGLTGAEADALFLSSAPGPASDLGLGGVLASAQLKLQAALPDGLAERTHQVRERFHLDAPAWFRDADPVPHLATIAESVWAQRTLRARYRGWHRETHRTLRPLGLVLKGGIWYLVAQPTGDDAEPRTYRISRFLTATPTDATFDRPPGFDLAAYWSAFAERLESARHTSLAQLRLSPRAQRLLPMYFGTAATHALRDASPPDADGWIRADLPVESPAMAVGDLLRLGPEAEVLGPPTLREAVAHAAGTVAARYATASGSTFDPTRGSMAGMKISVSLPQEDVAFLDAYAERTAADSRSAVLHAAIDALRSADLEAEYAEAFEEWEAGEDAALWEAATGDGLADAPR